MPKHRAQRRKVRSGRGVGLSAASQRSAATGRARARGTGPRSRALPRTFVSRWVRGSLVTPWFAAGAGIVVAALLAVESPHQVLSFGPPVYQHCSSQHCTAGVRPTPGSLAGSTPGVPIKHAQPANVRRAAVGPHAFAGEPARSAGNRAAPAHPPAAPVVTVHFQLLGRHRPGYRGFAALITLQGSKPGDWTLRFVLPGAQIERVWGAHWRPSPSDDGGTATGQPWPWPHSDGDQARIAILGTGTSGPPTGCVFDGARCSFS
jgi:hypothetical protein